ncbi:MAG: P-loop NTPase [Gemmatimonadetes bacterium]|nr:P-loop NTPase [Gemmatimonadota bacterium]
MRRIRTYHQVDDPAGAEVLEQVLAQQHRLAQRLARVQSTVLIGSGKGGVGKSAVAANLAAALGALGRQVGAADADLNGPSLARMLGAAGQPLRVVDDGVVPATGAAGVRVMSMDLLLAAEDAPLRWREPAQGGFIWQSTLETGAVREFLADTEWGALDYLLVDTPPGTDKLARLLELLPRPEAVLLVTTPSEMSRFVVAKSVRQVRNAGVRVLGLVANMTAYVCEHCGRSQPLFEGEGARRLAEAAGVPLWAEIPFDPRLASTTDAGRPLALDAADAGAGRALRELAERLEHELAAPMPSPGPSPSL